MGGWFRSLTRIPATILGFAACIVSYALHLGLPKTNGTVLLEGLRGEVKIIRDSWGIPHIFARNNHDLFFAFGYVHAQDRLWQMELSRRIASGTLAEVLGEDALGADLFMRRIGLWRSASLQIGTVSSRTRNLLDAYSKGINAYLASRPWWRLPIEFILLRYRPKPWTIIDSAAISKLIGWSISPNWDTEIVRSLIIDHVGFEKAWQLEPSYPEGGRITVPPGGSYQRMTDDFLDEYREFGRYISRYGGASNAWVVDGKKSVSGKPLLACDPHLPASMPSPWYEVHLSSPSLNVIGVSIAGLPAVIIGHNQHIAWGISSGLVDQKDVYWEYFNPSYPHQYLYEGNWRDAERITECIVVRGKANPVYEDVLITHHGPVISPMLKNDHRALAIQSVELESLKLLDAGYGIMRAKCWNDFRAALRDWSSPSMNFIYADTEGNIGYQLAGFIPIRRGRSGLIPSFGWNAKNDWAGFIPFDDLPSSLNPDAHFLAAANNMPSQDTPHGPIRGEWADPYRIQRISELLSSKKQLSFDDFREMQGDVFSILAKEIFPFLLQMGFTEKDTQKFGNLLSGWDYHLTPESTAAALYEVFGYKLYRNFFSVLLGSTYVEYYMGKSVNEMGGINGLGHRASSNLLRVLRDTPPDWFLGTGTTKEEVVRRSFRQAINYLRSRLGKNASRWQWGKIHTVSFSHLLARNLILKWIFTRGLYPLGGDANTIPQASYDPMDPFSCTASIVSYRQIIDLADINNSCAVNSTGASGQPGSRHFSDQITLWRNLEYHPMWFTREDIEKNAEAVLTLQPPS